MHHLGLIATLLLARGLLSEAKGKSKAESAILLSNVKTLTLHGDKQTSHRRVTPIPQLTCTGGNGCKHYNVDMMRCQNAGSEYDAEDIQWTCTASLPPEFKLGSTEVVCEGYDNADDPFVLKGSCGVEYRLLLTEEGERKYAPKQTTHRPKYNDYPKEKYQHSDSPISSGAHLIFWLIFVGIICLVLYRIFYPPNPHNGTIRLDGNNGPGFGGGGGGGGGWDNSPFDNPPPPYSATQPRTKPSSSRTTPAGSSRTQEGSNFWTGAATGAAAGGAAGYGAGYYHGSRTAEADRRQRERSWERAREQERSGERARERERAQTSTPSWFGSGSGGSGGVGSSFLSGSPSPSSSRHESTGFGGTRRR